MTYFEFFLWLSGIYSTYYLIIFLWDWAKQQQPANKDAEIHELTFIEQHTSEKIFLTEEPPLPAKLMEKVAEPVSKGHGGVTMKGLFELARKENIHLTSSVTF